MHFQLCKRISELMMCVGINLLEQPGAPCTDEATLEYAVAASCSEPSLAFHEGLELVRYLIPAPPQLFHCPNPLLDTLVLTSCKQNIARFSGVKTHQCQNKQRLEEHHVPNCKASNFQALHPSRITGSFFSISRTFKATSKE